MSEIDLDAIQTRATMATRGPWHVEWDGTGYPQRVFNDAAVLVAETCTGPEWPPTDAEFIAHARTDVPALLARIAELEADLSDAHHEGFGVGMESADRDIDQIAAAAERRGYERAVDAWRAAQPDQTAPTDRPSATESQDQGAADAAGTEGSQAQGGARGGEYLSSKHHIDEVRCSDTACSCHNAPGDPAGLDAAIEAARRSAHGVVWLDDAGQDQTIRIAVRAAAPHLRAAALNEAADAFDQAGYLVRRGTETTWDMFARWLRERAGREATNG